MKKYVEYTDGETGILLDVLCDFKHNDVEILKVINSDEDNILPLLNESTLETIKMFANDLFSFICEENI